jgi:histidine triad (HIT) family protein
MARIATCIFCDIAIGRAEASFVYQDDGCVAFLDIHPVNRGHVLVVPRRHAELLNDLPEDEASHLLAVAHRLIPAIKASGIKCEGIDVFVADGAVAMQDVPHVHLHIIPRWAGDGFGLSHDPERNFIAAARKDLDQAAASIRQAAASR